MAEGAPTSYRIVRARQHAHVTDSVVRALEDEVSAATGWRVVEPFGPLMQKVARGLRAASIPFPFKRHGDVFMVMMGPHRVPLNAADWLSARGRRVAWMFDVWPKDYDDLAAYVRQYGIDALFITAKQSADRIARALEGCDVKWCPEPCVDLGFRTKPWNERKTDVLQFGRRYEPYHQGLLQGLSGSHTKYVYEEQKGVVVFPTMTEFVLGLADAKVSVCFPCDMTHPDRASDVSTVTQRYFQSFASGCVVVGESPFELVQLFGYDPVVKADLADPAAQIEAILAQPEKYEPLVERNLIEVRNNTTADRMPIILRELS